MLRVCTKCWKMLAEICMRNKHTICQYYNTQIHSFFKNLFRAFEAAIEMQVSRVALYFSMHSMYTTTARMYECMDVCMYVSM